MHAFFVLPLLIIPWIELADARPHSPHWTSSLSQGRHLSSRTSTSQSQNLSGPAWNGQVLPGTVPDGSRFTPYYVPEGCSSIDDSSSKLVYEDGTWTALHRSQYVGRTLHSTKSTGASISLSFYGSSIEWFGTTGSGHGYADVYLDGVKATTVSAYSKQHEVQQRIWGVSDIAEGHHLLKLVNLGNGAKRVMDLDAFVIQPSRNVLVPAVTDSSRIQDVPGGPWTLTQRGETGVSAMQLSVVSDTHAIILDKVEHNPLEIHGHPAWGALYDLTTHEVRPLNVLSNSFCAGGTFLSNGTLINVGGNPVVTDKTGAADFGDVNGLQAVRFFTPCDDGLCDMYEEPRHIRMASPRWYTTVTRLDDGSALIIGGSKKGGWMNNVTVNNPTVEFYPPKNIHGYDGVPIPSLFLVDTLNSNLFPIAFTLPDGTIFMAANRDAMIYNWRTNKETRLPRLPNGVRVTYPLTGTAVLLPLTPANGYTPTILICGGTTIDDTTPGYNLTSQTPASDQCARMTLSPSGIASGWEVDHMPTARIMPDAVLLPDGRVVLVNGGQTGIAGYGNVQGQIGQSNAANPAFQPVVYDPSAPLGRRFSTEGMPTSNIPRLYHSVATLVPSGEIMIAGSNPNLDRSVVEYRTEYRVEWLSPPYTGMERPVLGGVPEKIGYGEGFEVQVELPLGTKNVTVSLMDLGYVTHSVHMNSRLVSLLCAFSPPPSSSTSNSTTLHITGPPSALVYPPGYGWLYVLADGVPGRGKRVMVGDGSGPPVDEGAIANLLKTTKGPGKSKGGKPKVGGRT